jgi:hypothetical protein
VRTYVLPRVGKTEVLHQELHEHQPLAQVERTPDHRVGGVSGLRLWDLLLSSLPTNVYFGLA